MRQASATLVILIVCTTLAGCIGSPTARVDRAVAEANIVDETNLSEIMLTVADPREAVAYFQGALSKNPDRLDLKRGLGKSLVRAQRATEAQKVWQDLVNSAGSTPEDKVMLADAQIRANEWPKAKATLNSIPPTHETFDRYRLEAMVADSERNWKRADSFYEVASGLTMTPAGVYNNWGFSKLTRKDYAGAERLFIQALTYEPSLFTAKNNLVMARAAQRKYDLPVIDMTQKERAELLYTMALSAIKQGDVTVGKGLLQQAVDTHPQHFEAASRSLSALESNVQM